MEISHVTRAEEWIPSFPKNILLYQAFGWKAPKFIHYPFIANKEGGKLSKRQGDVAVEDFRDKGYLPEALINFCGLLGWHPKDDNEILSLDEIIKKVVAIEQERLKKISDITEATKFFFVDDLNYEKDILAWRKMSAKEAQVNLSIVYKLLEKIPEENWTNDSIEDGLMTYLQAKELRVGEYLWPMRVALCGQKTRPGPFDIAEILGKSETMKRIEKSINLN